MKEFKIIFIASEVSALLGVIMLVFLTNWQLVDLFLIKVTIVILVIFAILCQKEQGEIKWESEE